MNSMNLVFCPSASASETLRSGIRLKRSPTRPSFLLWQHVTAAPETALTEAELPWAEDCEGWPWPSRQQKPTLLLSHLILRIDVGLDKGCCQNLHIGEQRLKISVIMSQKYRYDGGRKLHWEKEVVAVVPDGKCACST